VEWRREGCECELRIYGGGFGERCFLREVNARSRRFVKTQIGRGSFKSNVSSVPLAGAKEGRWVEEVSCLAIHSCSELLVSILRRNTANTRNVTATLKEKKDLVISTVTTDPYFIMFGAHAVVTTLSFGFR